MTFLLIVTAGPILVMWLLTAFIRTDDKRAAKHKAAGFKVISPSVALEIMMQNKEMFTYPREFRSKCINQIQLETDCSLAAASTCFGISLQPFKHSINHCPSA